MSFWDRFRSKEPPKEEDPSSPAPAPVAPRSDESVAAAAARAMDQRDLERLERLGGPEAPSEHDALALFRHLRTTPMEGRAIELVLSRSPGGKVPESLLLAAASALVDRGDPRAAARALASASSLPALLFAADLFADAGDFAPALAHVERVLLRDIAHAGARERHQRWRVALGFEDVRHRADTAAATVVASEPDSPFRLLREVARGGAGAVYEAEDRELHRKVALKIYHHPEKDRSQLTLEAKVAVALAGAHVVRVYDVDPVHGWLALEWAGLGALRDHLRAKDASILLPIERWAIPLATALARVHAKGWVHNDVKPANVLLRWPDAPLLSDFGIARRAGEPSPGGSMGYISPERLAGRASDARDDVYGFGRILEDVLDAVGTERDVARFRALASACTGPDEGRPVDGRAIVTRLRVEA